MEQRSWKMWMRSGRRPGERYPRQKRRRRRWHIGYWRITIRQGIWSGCRSSSTSWPPMTLRLSGSFRQQGHQGLSGSRFRMCWRTATILCVRWAEPSMRMTTCLALPVRRNTAVCMYLRIRRSFTSMRGRCSQAAVRWSWDRTAIHGMELLEPWRWAKADRSLWSSYWIRPMISRCREW